MGDLTYKDAGVDIEVGEETVRRIRERVRATFGPQVLSDIGGFGGFFSLVSGEYKAPVLVSSIDGVGTKLKVACLAGRYQTVGQDLVAHCANDILVHGAWPLFFLDYLAFGKLIPEVVEEVVEGLVRGCLEAGCALIGGETAEMPDVYQPGEFDLVGAIVGMVEREQIINGSQIDPGDRILGLASDGLHTNGFSLARKVLFEVAGYEIDTYLEELGWTVGEELLRTHRCYVRPIRQVLGRYRIKGMAHITGGGIPGNLVRILPQNCSARIGTEAWEVPPIFHLIQRLGQVPKEEMWRTFNMGIGLVVIAPGFEANGLRTELEAHGERVFYLGEILAGPREVELIDPRE